MGIKIFPYDICGEKHDKEYFKLSLRVEVSSFQRIFCFFFLGWLVLNLMSISLRTSHPLDLI